MLLSWKNYSKAIDIWSVGCILAEMIARKPFFKGNESEEQLQIIIDYLGYPKADELDFVLESSD